MAPAALAVDSPLGSGPVCDAEATQLCLSANGNDGIYLYSKTYSDDNQEDTTVAAANVCGGTDIVDGNGTNCPFKNGSGMNTLYAGDLIVSMQNKPENNMWYVEDATDVIQSSTGGSGSGYEWCWLPSETELLHHQRDGFGRGNRVSHMLRPRRWTGSAHLHVGRRRFLSVCHP
jgi:hypothetical protein